MPDGRPWMKAKDRTVWSAWLEKYHLSEDTMWLVFAPKSSKEKSIRVDEAVEEALCFGWIDGVLHKPDATCFAVRFTKRRARSLWSKVNVARVQRLIADGRMRPAGMVHVEHAKKTGAWAKAYSMTDAVEMPAELRDALAKNKSAAACFAALSSAQQRLWMRQVATLQKTESRVKKSSEVVKLILGGRKAGETDKQAAKRGVPSKAELLR